MKISIETEVKATRAPEDITNWSFAIGDKHATLFAQ
jgi:hypothetical protein